MSKIIKGKLLVDPTLSEHELFPYDDLNNCHDLYPDAITNNTVVKAFSKRQTTVESSTYGSELVAARLATDHAVELIYTLQMIGVPIDGSTLMLGDNKSVVINTTIPSSALKKKHNAIAYHRVCEAFG